MAATNLGVFRTLMHFLIKESFTKRVMQVINLSSSTTYYTNRWNSNPNANRNASTCQKDTLTCS